MPDGPITLDASEVEETPSLSVDQVEESAPKQYLPEVNQAVASVPRPAVPEGLQPNAPEAPRAPLPNPRLVQARAAQGAGTGGLLEAAVTGQGGGEAIPDAAVPALQTAKKVLVDPFNKIAAGTSAAGGTVAENLAGRALVRGNEPQAVPVTPKVNPRLAMAESATGALAPPAPSGPPMPTGATDIVGHLAPFTDAERTKLFNARMAAQESADPLSKPRAEYPITMAVAKGVGETVGGIVGDPRYLPFFGSSLARPALARLISAGFTAQMGIGTAQGAKELYQNWDQMKPAERAELATKTGITALFLAHGTIKTGGGYEALPKEPIARAESLFRNLIYKAGGTVPENPTFEQANAAYRAAMNNLHPDVNPATAEDAQNLNAAWATMKTAGSFAQAPPVPTPTRNELAEHLDRTHFESGDAARASYVAEQQAQEAPVEAKAEQPKPEIIPPTKPSPAAPEVAKPIVLESNQVEEAQKPATVSPKESRSTEGAKPPAVGKPAAEPVSKPATESAPVVAKPGVEETAATPSKEQPTEKPEIVKGGKVELADGRRATIEYAAPADKLPVVRLTAEDGEKVKLTSQKEIDQLKAATKYKYGSTQADIPESSEAHSSLESARARISDSDLAGKGKDVGGNHVTVRYGIQSEDVAGVKKYLASLAPFEASLGKTDKFPPTPNSDGAAVIHAPIESPELQKINAELEKHGDFTEPSFKEYRPHATIAYVDPAKAGRYTGMSVTEGKKFPVNEIAITDKNGGQTVVKLEGKKSSEQTPFGRPLTAAEKDIQNQPGTTGVAKDVDKWQPPPELGAFPDVPDIGSKVRAKNPEPTRAEVKEAATKKKTGEVLAPESKKLTNDEMNKAYSRQKSALTKAENLPDHQARKFAVLKAATQAVNEWEDKFDGWPDNWSRWQRSLDDAYQKFNHANGTSDQPPQLADLVGKDVSSEVMKAALGTKPKAAVPAIQAAKPELGPLVIKPIFGGPTTELPVETAKPTGAASLAQAVYDKLSKGESLGNVTEFNKLAEQHFGASRVSGQWTPKDAFDAMETGVNKYLEEQGKWLMQGGSQDFERGMQWLRRLMTRLTSQGVRTEEQIKAQQFSTPPTESYVVAKLANLTPSDVVLEPSAGNGGLAVFAKAAGAKVAVNEYSPRRVDNLKYLGFDKDFPITKHDGELINAVLDQKVKPTVVLMNPPFSSGVMKGENVKNSNQYGFNHVNQALQRLEDGGRLVAILGGGQANEPNGGAALTGGSSGAWFDKIAERYQVRANVRINGKEYQKYGTAFATRIIVIDKPGKGQFASLTGNPGWRDGVIKGNVDTLEEAYNLLRNVAESRPVAGGQNDTSRRAGSGSETNLQRPGSTGELESPDSRGASEGVSPTGVRVRTGGEPVSAGEIQSPAGRNEPDRSAGTVQPSETGERTPVREPRPTPEKPDEATAVESPRGGSEVSDRERPLRQPEVEGLVLGHEEQSVREQEDSSAYVTYKPTLKGPTHPGSIVETKTMSTVPMPEITYRPSLPDSVVKQGKLSAVQLEAVSIAGQQNDIVLPSGHRASALIGDGTGVGKGRIGAAILWDNWNKGRKRLVWVSEKWDLMEDAKRDLNGIGATELAKKVKGFDKWKATDPIDHEGLLFTTYALMRSKDAKGNSRAAQLQKWLRGNDEADGGYMSFDESHNLKNAVVGQMGVPSEIGQAVRKLLQDNPKLRTVSLSATAASDVMNLGYLDRLGLWGAGTPFPNGFGEFSANISGGGISAMEMVARELKAQGKYVSRTLSYKGVTYNEVEHKLTNDQKELYRTAVKAWRSVVQQAEKTIKETNNGGHRAIARFMSLFYGAQLRFFNVLLTTLKIPTAIEDANKALAQGKSVVITLVNTNEAAQNREKNRERIKAGDDDEPPDYDFGPAEMLMDLVREHYPTQQYADGVDDNGNKIKIPVVDAEGNPVHNPEAIKQKNALLEQIKKDLKLPKNPLDILLDAFGGPAKAAELTGRKERYDDNTGKFVKRGDANVKRDEVNLSEMRAFQEGKKRIAILSNAAGTGISLHADTNSKNQQKRHHITLQLGWSADKSMQMLGRTHRANQIHPPEYNTITSDLGGEKRFSAVIAKRLGNLGALSKGQKDANASADAMEKTNFDSDQGKKATQTFYNQLMRNQTIPGTEGWDKENPTKPMTGMSVLRDLAVLKKDPQTGIESVPDADKTNVTRLLNRLLALDPDIQNAVYNYYYDIFTATVNQAIEDGTLDTGVKALKGDEFTIKEERSLSTDPKTGAKTFYYPVEAQVRTNRVPPKDVEKLLKKNVGVRVMQNDKGKLALVRPAADIVHADGRTGKASYVVYPHNGVQQKVEDWKLQGFSEVGERAAEDKEKWEGKLQAAKDNLEYAKRTAERYDNATWAVARVKEYEETIDEAEKNLKELAGGDPQAMALSKWKEAYDEAPAHDTEEHHLLGGAVLRWWNQIREAIPGTLEIYTTVDSKTGKRVVGVEIPQGSIRKLLGRISGGGSTVDSGQLSIDVIKNGLQYELEQGIQVRKGRVNGNAVIQLIPPNDNVAQNLKRLGALYEKGITPVYYVPMKTKTEANEAILGKILGEYPVKQSEQKSDTEAEQQSPEEPPRVVPGARSAETGNETGKTSIQDLTDSISRQVPEKRPLKDRISRGADIGEKAGDATTSLGRAYDRIKGATAALWDAYGRLPKWTDYEDLTGKWSGADQINALDLERFTKAITTAVPEKIRREAISNWIEAGGDEEILRDRADKSEAPYKKGYETALTLTDAEKTIARNIMNRNDATLEEAQKAGLLEQGVENYVRHVYADSPKYQARIAAEMNFNSLQTRPSFTKQRKIPTYFDAEQLGFTPKNKDVGYLTAIHERSFREALAARTYIHALMHGKAEDARPLVMTSWASAKQLAPRDGEASSPYLIKPNIKAGEEAGDYRKLDHPALRGWRWAGKTSEGESIFVQGDAIVHPEIFRKLKNNLTKSAIRSYETEILGHTVHPGVFVLNASAEIKHAILSFSGFHQTTLAAHAAEHRTLPAGMPELDLNDPKQHKLVEHGLMVAQYDAEEAFGEGVASGGLVTKIPGIGPAYGHYTQYLFRNYLPRIKMATALNALRRNFKRYGDKLSEDQIYAITASQSNASFGGLNYRMLGRNKTIQDVLRIGLMAPDFFEARARYAGQAAKPYGREQLVALVGGAVVIYAILRMLNEITDRDPHWDKPFSVVYRGKEYTMRLIQEDIFRALTDPGKYMMNRLSPVVTTAIRLGEGRNEFGKKETAGELLKQTAKRQVPIPMQPWTRESKDTNAQKAVETIAKMVGVNMKNAHEASEQRIRDKVREGREIQKELDDAVQAGDGESVEKIENDPEKIRVLGEHDNWEGYLSELRKIDKEIKDVQLAPNISHEDRRAYLDSLRSARKELLKQSDEAAKHH